MANDKKFIAKNGFLSYGDIISNNNVTFNVESTETFAIHSVSDAGYRSLLQLVADYDRDVGLQIRNNISTELWDIWIDGASDDRLHITDTGGAYSLTIKQSGEVGIGSSQPGQKLDVNGNIRVGNADEFRSQDTGGSDRTIMRINSSNQLEYGWSGAGPVKFMGGGSYTERMRISTAGYVGIGTDDPHNTLHNYTSSGEWRVNEYGGMHFHNLTDSTNERYVHGRSDGSLSIGYVAIANLTGGDGGYAGTAYDHLTITSGGNTGIGTASPDFRLHVYSPTTNVTARFESGDDEAWIDITDSSSGYGALIGHKSSTNTLFKIADSGVNERFTILEGGNVGINETAPDAKLEINNSSTAMPALHIKGSNGSATTNRGIGTGPWILLDNVAAGTSTGYPKTAGIVYQASNADNGYSINNNEDYAYVMFNRTNSPQNNSTQIEFGTQPSTGSATTRMTISPTGTVGIGTDSPLRLLSVSSPTTRTSGFEDIAEFITPSIGGGGSVSLNIGRANSTKNLGKMAFKFNGAGSNSNHLGFGFYDADNLMVLQAGGNVGIGSVTPQVKLDVAGSARVLGTLNVAPASSGHTTFQLGSRSADPLPAGTGSYDFQPGMRVGSYEKGDVGAAADIALAWVTTDYTSSSPGYLAASQTYATASFVRTFTITQKAGTRWFCKVKLNDAESGNDPRIAVNNGTEYRFEYLDAVNAAGEAVNDSDTWHVFDITDDVVTGSNTLKAWLASGQKTYILAVYVFASTGIALPNEPAESTFYSHDGFGVMDTRIINKSRDMDNINTLRITGGSGLSTLAVNSNPLTIGPISGSNLALDANEIQSRNNGAAFELLLQKNGGNVGIGTNNPVATLDVAGGTARIQGFSSVTSGEGLELRYIDTDNAGSMLAYDRDNSAYRTLRLEGSAISLREEGTDVVWVNGSKVGIGTTTISYGRLQVNQTANNDESGIGILDSTAGRSMRLWVDSTDSYVSSGNGGTGILQLNEGGGLVLISKGSTADYTGNQTGVVKKTFQVHDTYDTAGTHWSAYANLDGNWLDGATGSDSQHGWIFGHSNNVRGGLIYDHRSTERMAMWSSYGRMDFLIANTTDGNGVPIDSNIVEAMTIEVGGNVGVGTTNPAEKLDVRGNIQTTGYFNKERGSEEIFLRAQDSGGDYTIYHTINDSHGNYNIMLGVNGAGQHTTTGDGGAKVYLTGHGTAGYTSINAANTGTAGNSVTYNIGLGVDSATAAVYVGNPGDNVGLDQTGDGYKIADSSGRIYGSDILGNQTYSGPGQIALSRSNNNPYLSFHHSDGSREGYIQTIAGGTMYIANENSGQFTFRAGTTVSDPPRIQIEADSQGNTAPGDMYGQLQFKVVGAGGVTASGITGTDVNTIAMIAAQDFRNGSGKTNEDSGIGFYTTPSSGSLTYRGGISNLGTWFIGSWNNDNNGDINSKLNVNGRAYVSDRIGIGAAAVSNLDIRDTGTYNILQMAGSAGNYTGIKLARGDGTWSSVSNNQFGLLVTDYGMEVTKLTSIGDNNTGRLAKPYMQFETDTADNVGIGTTAFDAVVEKTNLSSHATSKFLINYTPLLGDKFNQITNSSIWGAVEPKPIRPSRLRTNVGTTGQVYTNAFGAISSSVKGEADLSAIDGAATFTFAAAWAALETHGARMPTLGEIMAGVGQGSGQGYDSQFLWTQTFAGPHHVWVVQGAYNGSASYGAKIVDITDPNEVYCTRGFYDQSHKNMSVHYDNNESITTNELMARGDVTAYYSDERLKDFQGTIPDALEKVNQLNGYLFTENELAKELGYSNDRVQAGVSAQEVEAVLPEVVKEAPINEGNGTDYKTVQYDRLVPLLIESIKELTQQNQELRERLDRLEDNQ